MLRKQRSACTDALGLRRGTVVLLPQNPAWQAESRRIICVLKSVFGTDAADIQHVGSTAIRSICAKPIVDIAVGVYDMACTERHVAELARHGIMFRGEDVLGQRLFAMGDFEGDTRTAHIHVVLHKSPAWDNYLFFRDYLNAHGEAAAEYDQLKATLAARFPDDRDAYTAAKQGFIASVLAHRATDAVR